MSESLEYVQRARDGMKIDHFFRRACQTQKKNYLIQATYCMTLPCAAKHHLKRTGLLLASFSGQHTILVISGKIQNLLDVRSQALLFDSSAHMAFISSGFHA